MENRRYQSFLQFEQSGRLPFGVGDVVDADLVTRVFEDVAHSGRTSVRYPHLDSRTQNAVRKTLTEKGYGSMNGRISFKQSTGKNGEQITEISIPRGKKGRRRL